MDISLRPKGFSGIWLQPGQGISNKSCWQVPKVHHSILLIHSWWLTRVRERIDSLPIWLMGIEGDVDSCLYEIAGSHLQMRFKDCLVSPKNSRNYDSARSYQRLQTISSSKFWFFLVGRGLEPLDNKKIETRLGNSLVNSRNLLFIGAVPVGLLCRYET